MTARPECRRCLRPVSVCYCAALTTIDTLTRIVILQHPRERDMPIGTARMASLCLPQVKVHVGVRWDESPALRDATGDPVRPAILLYPGPGARDILSDPPAGPVTLVVVDGTWSQTKKLIRENPVLAALPRYAFEAPTPSEYRIRREPSAEVVSTIEALMHVLGALEGDAERFRALLGPFRAMVDAHIAAQQRCRVARTRRPRLRPTVPPGPPIPRLPAEITTRFADLVCVVGEANSWPYTAVERGLGDELVHWTARRVASGETFDVVAAPQKPLAPCIPGRIGIDEDRLRRGVAHAELHAAFAAFLRPTDVICAWGHYGPRLYRESRGALPDHRIDLRDVARRVSGRKVGTVEQYVASLPAEASVGASAPAVPLPAGRAGRRLGLLVRVLDAWRTPAHA